MNSKIDKVNGKQEYTLSEMLNAQTVEARVDVSDWEEATERVGGLLVRCGCVKESYIDALKRVLSEMGPYAVIAPGIVLLHARPEDGVLKPCIGLVTLTTPVKFGHSQNDPVDLVFGLGALDKNAHLHALQQLASFLGDKNALKDLRSALDADTIIQIITTWPVSSPE